jgi:glyceraldehyde-3-phosphate dehydrogenase/erythrose-4-phosphate dehydrogenase
LQLNAAAASIHSYTSDQALQDYAGSDIRHSRSAAKNIIPNSHEAGAWLGRIHLPSKASSLPLNVPIRGCLLDVNLVLQDGRGCGGDQPGMRAPNCRESSGGRKIPSVL